MPPSSSRGHRSVTDGAAVLHIYAWTADGRPTQDAADYPTIAAIRTDVPDPGFKVTTATSPGLTDDKRLKSLRRMLPWSDKALLWQQGFLR